MNVIRDYQGRSIRITDERMNHILEHPEMGAMASAIEETLMQPQQVIQSLGDADARLYYRYYRETVVGDKYLCAVVKVQDADAFVITAYLTDRLKKGTSLWSQKS